MPVLKKTVLALIIAALVMALIPCVLPVQAESTSDGDAQGRVTFNGNQYLFVNATFTWAQAKSYCELLGGHLVTVTSQEEEDFCRNLWESSTTLSCWLGASDAAVEGEWCWVTGEPFEYSAWNTGEPNNGSGNEDMLGYYAEAVGDRWNDFAGDRQLTFICEWEAGAQESISVTLTDSVLAGTVLLENSYYKFFSTACSWSDAKAKCEAMGGHLVTVTTESEDVLCRKMWQESGAGGCWLGASDSASEGTWQWVTGEEWGYTNWASGEPNGGTRENGLAFYSAYSNGKWNDSGSSSYPFICEWSAEEMAAVQGVSGTVTSTATKYNGAFYFGGNMYKIFEYPIDYQTAKALCEQLGGHLATVNTPEEDAALFNYLNGLGKRSCILGGSDVDEEGVWRWIDGDPLPDSYWDAGEPNDGNGSGQDHLHYAANGKWDDIAWSNIFLCEWDNFCIRQGGQIAQHDLVIYETLATATCASRGRLHGSCTKCKYKVTVEIPKLSHSFGEWEVGAIASCETQGVEYRRCSLCEETEYILHDALPHEWGEWFTVTPAGCNSYGEEHQVCTRCNALHTQSIEALDHAFDEDGICELCGIEEEEEEGSGGGAFGVIGGILFLVGIGYVVYKMKFA